MADNDDTKEPVQQTQQAPSPQQQPATQQQPVFQPAQQFDFSGVEAAVKAIPEMVGKAVQEVLTSFQPPKPEPSTDNSGDGQQNQSTSQAAGTTESTSGPQKKTFAERWFG